MSSGARRGLYTGADLEPLVSPATIALIGASKTPGSLAAKTLANLAGADLQAPPFLVNPRYPEIDGQACYPSVRDLPAIPDLW